MKKLFKIVLLIFSLALVNQTFSQEKFLQIKGKVVDRFSEKKRVKDVDIIVVNIKKDTLLNTNSKNGKYTIWLPYGEVMDVYFYTRDYLPKYFTVNTRINSDLFKGGTFFIDAEVSLTPYDEAILDATPFDEPIGYINFSTSKNVFYWDESYTKEIRRYMAAAYMEQARLSATEWLTTEKAFVLSSKTTIPFVIPSAEAFVLQYVFESGDYNLAMDKKDTRKASLVKEWGIILGGMIEVNKEYLLQFGDKEAIQTADNLIYSVTEIKKPRDKDMYILPEEPNIILAENLFYKLGQWFELTHFAIQVVPNQPVLIWNVLGHILLAKNLTVASHLSDSILSFISDLKVFQERCREFEAIIKKKGAEKTFKENLKEFNQLKEDFIKLYNNI